MCERERVRKRAMERVREREREQERALTGRMNMIRGEYGVG